MFQDVRYSGADSLPCTNNGCIDDCCMCQPCPICQDSEKRVPLCILVCKSQFTSAGRWRRPHCTACDINDYFGRQLEELEENSDDDQEMESLSAEDSMVQMLMSVSGIEEPRRGSSSRVHRFCS
jgi:hypothetical protein